MNYRLFGYSLGCVLVLASTAAFGHTEHDKARFVASNGLDAGACDMLASPCASVAYAARQANKGDRILIAGGSYAIESAEDLFFVTAGLLQVVPGFNRYDLYRQPDPVGNPVMLTGVPVAYRSELEARGFHVVADGKTMDRTAERQGAQMLEAVAAMSVAKAAAPCTGGTADGLACESIDLLSHTPLNVFSTNPSQANDIWGFFDLNTFREYVVIGLRNGYSIMDVTAPEAPVEVASFSATSTTWRDIKILQQFDATTGRFEAYAYVTADGASDQLQIVDLSNLPHSATRLTAGGDFQAAHNVYLTNTDYATGLPLAGTTPRLHIAGASTGGGALREFSLAQATTPALTHVTPGGYSHDAASFRVVDARASQCANATGTCEVVADFNESTIELWDVTGGAAPVQLSSTPYNNFAYTHSGWATEDSQFLFVHDELDEQQRGLNTTLRIFSLADLQAPTLVGTWSGPTRAIDHNGFVRGNRYYMSNYTRGLTILDVSAPANPIEVGFLDTFAPSDTDAFSGAWGVYPFLPSGTIAVSDIDSGLYLAVDQTRSSAAGRLTIRDANQASAEGDTLAWTVDREDGSTGAVSVDYSFIPAGIDNNDLSIASGTLTWAAGDNAPQQISVVVQDNGLVDPLRTVVVSLHNPQGGATLGTTSTGFGAISDIGSAAELAFLDSQTVSVSEDAAQAVVTIRRIGSAVAPATVDVTVGGSASEGQDFSSNTPAQLSWGAGDSSPRSLTFTIIDDSDDEPNETLQVTLSNPQGAAIAGASTVERTIIDNDTTTPTPTTPTTPPSTGGGGGGGLSSLWVLLLLSLGWRRRIIRRGL